VISDADQFVEAIRSVKIANHIEAVALGYFAYNFIKIHRTLRLTPAMPLA
jgi:hypothetical protein